MPDFYAVFGAQLREIRDSAGISQQTLGERVGLTRGSIANIEAGRQRVALHVFASLADALEVQPMALFPDRTPIIDDELLSSSIQDMLQEIPRRWAGESSKTMTSH